MEKRDFADVLKLKTLRCRDYIRYPGGSNLITVVIKRRRQKAQSLEMVCDDERRGQSDAGLWAKMWVASRIWKNTRKRIPLWVLLTMLSPADFSSLRLILDFSPWRKWACVVLRHEVFGSMLNSKGKLINQVTHPRSCNYLVWEWRGLEF